MMITGVGYRDGGRGVSTEPLLMMMGQNADIDHTVPNQTEFIYGDLVVDASISFALTETR